VTSRRSDVMRWSFPRRRSRPRLPAFATFARLWSGASCRPASAALSSGEQNALQISHTFIISLLSRHHLLYHIRGHTQGWRHGMATTTTTQAGSGYMAMKDWRRHSLHKSQYLHYRYCHHSTYSKSLGYQMQSFD